MLAQEILKKYAFRATVHRIEVLNHFMNSRRALKHSDLEEIYKNKIDRVSLYRILYSFSEKKILCKLMDSSGTISYVFDEHSMYDHYHIHPHYKCKNCNDVLELPELPESYMMQLKKLNIEHLNILAEGTCDNCLEKKTK